LAQAALAAQLPPHAAVRNTSVLYCFPSNSTTSAECNGSAACRQDAHLGAELARALSSDLDLRAGRLTALPTAVAGVIVLLLRQPNDYREVSAETLAMYVATLLRRGSSFYTKYSSLTSSIDWRVEPISMVVRQPESTYPLSFSVVGLVMLLCSTILWACCVFARKYKEGFLVTDEEMRGLTPPDDEA